MLIIFLDALHQVRHPLFIAPDQPAQGFRGEGFLIWPRSVNEKVRVVPHPCPCQLLRPKVVRAFLCPAAKELASCSIANRIVRPRLAAFRHSEPSETASLRAAARLDFLFPLDFDGRSADPYMRVDDSTMMRQRGHFMAGEKHDGG